MKLYKVELYNTKLKIVTLEVYFNIRYKQRKSKQKENKK
jgi:hypothetical protein